MARRRAQGVAEGPRRCLLPRLPLSASVRGLGECLLQQVEALAPVEP